MATQQELIEAENNLRNLGLLNNQGSLQPNLGLQSNLGLLSAQNPMQASLQNSLTAPGGVFSGNTPGGAFSQMSNNAVNPPPKKRGVGGFFRDAIGLALNPNFVENRQMRELIDSQNISEGKKDLLKLLSRNEQIEYLTGEGKGNDRRIVVQDGIQYYVDTGERVLPNVINKDPEENKNIFNNQDKLRDDFRAESKEFLNVRDSYGRILAVGSKDATPAGDLSLIFNYMKMLDPGSVVRESEFANAAASGSYGERIRAQVDRVQSGERLSEAMRQDFVQQAANLYQAQLDGHLATKNYYSNLANDFGFKVESIVQDYTSSLAPNIFKTKIRFMSDDDLGILDFSDLAPEQQKVVEKELKRRTP